jgi:integrase
MFLDTGLRLSELASLNLSDINLDSGIIKIIVSGHAKPASEGRVKTGHLR